LAGHRNVLVISSFSDDEPLAEVMQAATLLDIPDVRLYVSGNPSRSPVDWASLAPENVVLTGYLSASDYVNLLFAVDAVMVLTTADHTMLCGCYEAMAAGKPLITSDKPVLVDYFRGAEFVAADAASILAGLQRVLADLARYRVRTAEMEARISRDWDRAFSELAGHLVVC
jgi:glycosyltransferase involved in cell wall biosynthesis